MRLLTCEMSWQLTDCTAQSETRRAYKRDLLLQRCIFTFDGGLTGRKCVLGLGQAAGDYWSVLGVFLGREGHSRACKSPLRCTSSKSFSDCPEVLLANRSAHSARIAPLSMQHVTNCSLLHTAPSISADGAGHPKRHRDFRFDGTAQQTYGHASELGNFTNFPTVCSVLLLGGAISTNYHQTLQFRVWSGGCDY